ncbi:MAG TPA: non-canonical purine NTP pyrophosphatase [Candidatus Portnoybacteria bacterium]|nr:non-canonical purine NTP pyrophosphatase [Candidatus Portnoybacteria bacterium]
MDLFFITGNNKKFEEAQLILPSLKQLNIDLPEIQEIDAHKVVENKIKEALKHKNGNIIVEDTSLYLDCLNGLPGPLIKWFTKTIKINGLAKIAHKLENTHAQAKTIVGYAENPSKIFFFEGIIEGNIVTPRGERVVFGWNSIFQPTDHSKTFAEMDLIEKNQLSMRGIAFQKLKEFLENK